MQEEQIAPIVSASEALAGGPGFTDAVTDGGPDFTTEGCV